MAKPKRISDESLIKATSKPWNSWFQILDEEKAVDLSHKEVAKLLGEKYKVPGWWCQTITVEYERARGKRVLGQTSDLGFEIGVQKTVDKNIEEVWSFITSKEGLNIWLGTSDIELEKGYKFETNDGVTGEVRSVHELKRIRVRWKPKDWNSTSTVEIHFLPKDEKTAIGFHQEKLESLERREEMKEYWGEKLNHLLEKITI